MLGWNLVEFRGISKGTPLLMACLACPYRQPPTISHENLQQNKTVRLIIFFQVKPPVPDHGYSSQARSELQVRCVLYELLGTYTKI